MTVHSDHEQENPGEAGRRELADHGSSRVRRVDATMATATRFSAKFGRWKAAASDDHSDFTFGNPQEMPLPAYIDALLQNVPPRHRSWYGYTLNAPEAQQVIAASLHQQFDRPFAPEDIFFTNGAAGALYILCLALLDPGDEAIFLRPAWSGYEGIVTTAGGVPVSVPIDLSTFDLDLDALEAAITHKSRFVIVNSPHNPTGKIYPPATLRALAKLLKSGGDRFGRPIYLVSDETYRRILFDGNAFYTPASFYPHTFMVYTYSKTLLTPGQRLGYIALAPDMPHREQLRSAVLSMQMHSGWAASNALLQHAIPDLEKLSIDVEHVQYRRDRLVSALRDSGYELHVPEAALYLLPRSPLADDKAFVDMLAEHEVFCLPGSVAEIPGYFRICLTASDVMIERAIPRFAAVRRRALPQRSLR